MTFSTAKRSASVSRAMRITGALFPVLLSLFARGAFGAHGVFLRVRVAAGGDYAEEFERDVRVVFVFVDEA